MFLQHFIKLSAAVHELLLIMFTEKIGDDAENNTVVASADRNNTVMQYHMAMLIVKIHLSLHFINLQKNNYTSTAKILS